MKKNMKRHILVFLYSGGAFVILLALVIYLSYPSTIVQIISYALIAGCVFGLIITIIVSGLKLPQKAAWWNYARNASVLLIIGFITGIVSFNMLDRFPFGYWHKLPDPPEPMLEFVGKTPHNLWGGDIFVKSENSELYTFSCVAERPCGWEKVDEIPPENDNSFFPCFSETTKLPPEPHLQGITKDILKFEICGVDYSIYKSYAIDEQGKVYTYDRWSSVYELFSVLPLIIAAALVSTIPGNFFIKQKLEIDEQKNVGA